MPATRKGMICIVLLAGFAFAVWKMVRRPGTHLELREVWAQSLGRDMEIGGIAGGSGGRGLVWSPRGMLAVIDGPGKPLRRIGPSTTHAVGAALLPGFQFEVFDGELPGVIRLDSSGAMVQRVQSDGIDHAVFASRTTRFWYVVAAGPSGRYALYRVLPGAVPERLFTFVDSVSEESPRFRLSTADNDALITELAAPYRVFRIDTAGHATQIARSLRLTGEGLPPELDIPDAYWASLPAIAIEDHYLQTLVDLRSDRRVMLLYDANGRFVRRKSLYARMTPVAAIADDHTLLALRQLDGTEMVGYTWTIHR